MTAGTRREQVGVHHTDEVASAGGADIDGDGEDEHSNVHIGELQWGSDPADMDGVPAVGVDVEADFLEGLPNQELNRPEWERGIEQNYALYGIHLDIERDDTIASSTDLLDIPGVLKAFYDGHKAHDEPTDLYLFVTRSVPTGAFGINWGAIIESGGEAIPEQYGGNPFEDTAANTHLIYASEIYDYTDSVADYEDFAQTPYTSELQLVAAGVELHESVTRPTSGAPTCSANSLAERDDRR